MSSAKDIKIESLDHLKRISSKNSIECYIILGSCFRSSKMVLFMDPGWWVLHEIDDTEMDYENDEHLMDTHIGEAIEKGAMYAYVYNYMSEEDVSKLTATQPDPVEQRA
jgi:hypothetical protein